MAHPSYPESMPTFQAGDFYSSQTVHKYSHGDGPQSWSGFQKCIEDQALEKMTRSGKKKHSYKLCNATNKEFMDMIHLYQGPNAIIVIGDDDEKAEKWEIPKKLLCHYSDYFKDALQPNITDDDKHTLYFEGSIRDAFCAIVRLLYTGIIIFDKAPTPTASITQCLDFFHLGERLDIEWARTKIEIIAHLVERILVKHKDALTPAHIRSTFDLPVQHPMRTFVAEMCYKIFLDSKPHSLTFWNEWIEVPGFWCTVLLASKKVVLEAGIMNKDYQWESADSSDDEDDEDEEGAEIAAFAKVEVGATIRVRRMKDIKKEVKEEFDGNNKSYRDLNAIITKELEEEKENFMKMRMDGQ